MPQTTRHKRFSTGRLDKIQRARQRRQKQQRRQLLPDCCRGLYPVPAGTILHKAHQHIPVEQRTARNGHRQTAGGRFPAVPAQPAAPKVAQPHGTGHLQQNAHKGAYRTGGQHKLCCTGSQHTHCPGKGQHACRRAAAAQRWMCLVEKWWYENISTQHLRTVSVQDRVKLICDVTNLKDLVAAEKIEYAKSDEFWCVCKGLNKPLDPLDGLLIANQDHLYIWQDQEYVSVYAALMRINRGEWQNIAAVEQGKFETLKRIYSKKNE